MENTSLPPAQKNAGKEFAKSLPPLDAKEEDQIIIIDHVLLSKQHFVVF